MFESEVIKVGAALLVRLCFCIGALFLVVAWASIMLAMLSATWKVLRGGRR